MKSTIFKLCPVVLLFLFLGASCQKDEWEEIVLNDSSCSGVIGILDSFTDYSGTVRNMFTVTGTNTFFIIVNDPETSTELRYMPCNLPAQYQEEGLNIIFSGEILNLKDWVDGEAQASFIGTPVKLINAKIKR